MTTDDDSSDEAAAQPTLPIPVFDLTADEFGDSEATPLVPRDAALALRQPNVEIGERREGIRGRLAMGLLLLLAGTILFGFATVGFDWATPDETKDLVALLITPLVGLVGAATGFYFGGANDSG